MLQKVVRVLHLFVAMLSFSIPVLAVRSVIEVRDVKRAEVIVFLVWPFLQHSKYAIGEDFGWVRRVRTTRFNGDDAKGHVLVKMKL
jgi:hypothetical protein